MEQQTPTLPPLPKSRMKPRKSQHVPFSHPWFVCVFVCGKRGGGGGGVEVFANFSSILFKVVGGSGMLPQKFLN